MRMDFNILLDYLDITRVNKAEINKKFRILSFIFVFKTLKIIYIFHILNIYYLIIENILHFKII
jgi:hypothetical protein